MERSISHTAARWYSAWMPFSVMLLLEPTPAWSLEPSGLAVGLFVQWWSIGPPGSSVSFTPGVMIDVWPVW